VIDKNLLLSETLSKRLSEIMNMYFQYNRILDALIDYLDVDMNMNMMSNYIHETFAHRAPLDADSYRSYNSSNSRRTIYSDIEASDGNYENPLVGFEYALEYTLKIMDAIQDGIDLAKSENDEDTKKFLQEELKNMRVYKKQFVFLCDKSEKSIQEGNTWQDIDHRWDDFATIPMVIGDDENDD
jgi:ferritin